MIPITERLTKEAIQILNISHDNNLIVFTLRDIKVDYDFRTDVDININTFFPRIITHDNIIIFGEHIKYKDNFYELNFSMNYLIDNKTRFYEYITGHIYQEILNLIYEIFKSNICIFNKIVVNIEHIQSLQHYNSLYKARINIRTHKEFKNITDEYIKSLPKYKDYERKIIEANLAQW